MHKIIFDFPLCYACLLALPHASILYLFQRSTDQLPCQASGADASIRLQSPGHTLGLGQGPGKGGRRHEGLLRHVPLRDPRPRPDVERGSSQQILRMCKTVQIRGEKICVPIVPQSTNLEMSF